MIDRALTADEIGADTTPGINEAVSDDFLFFRWNPHRRYRLRPASPAEQFEAALAGMRAADTEGVFVVCRFFFDGGKPPIDAFICLRAFLRLPSETQTNVPDYRAKSFYDGLLAKRPHLASRDAELAELAKKAMESEELQQLAGLEEGDLDGQPGQVAMQ